MAKLFDRVGQNTTTTGTASPITLGSVITDATNGDLATFLDMGAVAGDVVNYVIVDVPDWEIGTGTLGGTGPGFTLTRSVVKSKISGTVGTTALTLSGAAKVYSVPANAAPNWWIKGVKFNNLYIFHDAVGPFATDDGSIFCMDQNLGMIAAAGRRIGWTADTTIGPNYNVDTVLTRDAAGVIAQKNSTNAQTFRVYGSDGGANYSRLSISHAGGTSGATIATEAGGTGTAGPIFLNAGSGVVLLSNDTSSGFPKIQAASSGVASGSYITLAQSNYLIVGGNVAGGNKYSIDTVGNIQTQGVIAPNVSGTPGTIDTALGRNAAGVIEINNGTAGAYRDLILRNATVVGGTLTANMPFTISQTNNNAAVSFTAFKISVTDTASNFPAKAMAIYNGSTEKGYWDVYGGVNATALTTTGFQANGGNFVRVGSSTPLGFGNNADASFGSMDAQFMRDAAQIIAQKNSTNAQTFRVYGSDGGANYSRLSISHAGGTSGATIATEAGGTGTAGPLTLQGSSVVINSQIAIGSGGSGTFILGYNPTNCSLFIDTRNTGGIVSVNNAGQFQWSASADANTTTDTALARNAAGIVEVNNGSAGTYRDLKARLLKTAGTTVASLVAAATAGAGARSFVTDATATTFATTVVGGGSNAVPVWCDGTNWKIG